MRIYSTNKSLYFTCKQCYKMNITNYDDIYYLYLREISLVKI